MYGAELNEPPSIDALYGVPNNPASVWALTFSDCEAAVLTSCAYRTPNFSWSRTPLSMCQAPSSLTASILSVVGWLYSPLTPSALNKFGFKEFWPGSMLITGGSPLIVEVALMRPIASSARVEATSFASAGEA